MKTKNTENKICGICGRTEITTEENVGWDIDEGGEETQHIDHCKCGAWRFNIDRYEDFTDYKKIYGEWHKDKI